MKLLILLLLASCAATPKLRDLESNWKGKSEETLEKNKFFSTLPLKKESLSTGEIRYNYSQSRLRATGGQTCFGTGYGVGYYNRFGMSASSCSPQEYTQDNCNHQFIIKNGKVVSYDLVGENCELDCKMLPEGKCSKD